MAELRGRLPAATASAALLVTLCACTAGGPPGRSASFGETAAAPPATAAPPTTAAPAGAVPPDARRTLHFAPNDNFGREGKYRPGRFGFTLADVSSPSVLRTLPHGVAGLVYLGLCGGNTRHFRSVVTAYRPVARVFGFYLMDVPDPHTCRARRLGAEARFIHRRLRHAVTFVELQNPSSSKHPDYRSAYTRAATGIDLFGVSPYPCRTELHGCDLQMISRYLRAARRAGIRRQQIVPVFQAFGGGRWRDDGGGRYVLPTARQERALLCRWHRLVPSPTFDYAYSWGVQRNDTALATAPAALRRVFAAHNAGTNCASGTHGPASP